ncbi:MAG: alpha/beta hydrolase [Lachnospiraceae bacterium]|nr:alpha/beta hydrolase [Lachnospiraceae bacterium]
MFSGKYEKEYVKINDIEEFFLHFPSLPEKEVVLFIHGGPGTSEAVSGHDMYEAHKDKFNIVYYDQRGAGKTYMRNPDKEADINNILKDLEESVEYIKQKYNKEKIIILGHSWGTIPGALYVKKHPENVIGYVGVAQIVNINDSERARVTYLKNLMQEKRKNKQVKFLDELIEATEGTLYEERLTKKQLNRLRMMQIRNKMLEGASLSMLKIMKNSPVYEKTDLKVMMSSKKRSAKLWDYIYKFDLYKEMKEWPVKTLFISGSKDFQVPYSLLTEYCRQNKDGNIQLEIYEDAGHFFMFDQSAKFWDMIYQFSLE